MAIEFQIKDCGLFLIYSPELSVEEVNHNLVERGKIRVKNCFTCLREKRILTFDYDDFDPEETFVFEIGVLDGEYYKLHNEVINTQNTFFFHNDIKLKSKYFIAQKNISILSKIDGLVTEDVYIGPAERANLPFETYLELINQFPNSYELKLYSRKRVSLVLNNYFDGLGACVTKYERYLDRKTNTYTSVAFEDTKHLQLEILKKVHSKMEAMLKECDAYNEEHWQDVVCDALLLIYPKYILAKREVVIGTDGRKRKKPDFLLVDSCGFVDLLEIKKPNGQKLITQTAYRNNYVADRDFAGAIVQIEKYLYTLAHEGEKCEKYLQNKLTLELPKGLEIKVVNPQGMLLMGRSIELSNDQRFDFEVIKRQHKNIVDVMTYDDLLGRLQNMISQLSTK